MKIKRLVCFALSLLMLFCVFAISGEKAFAADTLAIIDKILASDGETEDFFGKSIAISGDKVVVGAYYNDDNGSVYIYDLSNGASELKLTASDGGSQDYFGYSVAISGDNVVVGAYGDDDKGLGSGSVYIYDLSEADVQGSEQKLTASDGASFDLFGCSVAISGDKVVVGASYDNTRGSVYIYDLSNGNGTLSDVLNSELKLTASDGAEYNYFGSSVAISGNKVAVGAHEADPCSAYIYDLSEADVQGSEQKLTASDGASFDLFGCSVAISGDNLVVGALVDSSKGAVYIYDLSSGSLTDVIASQQKLSASDGAAGDCFGSSVAISGDNVIVGASYDNTRGSVYIYDLSNGNGTLSDVLNSELKLTASDGAEDDYFGNSVAISGGNVVVGANGDDDKGTDSGSVYYLIRNIVTFDAQGGDSVSDQILVDGYYINKPTPDPTKTGYTFGGWYTDSACSDDNRWNFTTSPVTGDITLYAKWTSILAIDTPNLLAATIGESYSCTVTASGGDGSNSWYASGLPDGLSMVRDTGVISGKPNETGTFSVGVRVYDGEHRKATKTYSLTVSSPSATGKYEIVPDSDSTYTVSTVDGFTTLTIKSGISGFRLINVTVNPIITHEGTEFVVFTHTRNGVQIGYSFNKADFDVTNIAGVGFNVQSGDAIKIYVVDELSNDPSVNPVLLQ